MRKALSITVVIFSLSAISLGYFRKEHKLIYINAAAICYSCIGLE